MKRKQTRLQTEQLFVSIFISKPAERNFILSRLNTRHLRKHKTDINNILPIGNVMLHV